MSTFKSLAALILVIGLTTPAATAEDIDWFVVGGAGATASSGGLRLSGTVGQTSDARGTSNGYRLQAGFWQSLVAPEDCCIGYVGDANGSGDPEPTIGDISTMIDAKFIAVSCDGLITCFSEADVNQSGGLYPDCNDITIGDISILIDYLFITFPPNYGPLNDCY